MGGSNSHHTAASLVGIREEEVKQLRQIFGRFAELSADDFDQKSNNHHHSTSTKEPFARAAALGEYLWLPQNVASAYVQVLKEAAQDRHVPGGASTSHHHQHHHNKQKEEDMLLLFESEFISGSVETIGSGGIDSRVSLCAKVAQILMGKEEKNIKPLLCSILLETASIFLMKKTGTTSPQNESAIATTKKSSSSTTSASADFPIIQHYVEGLVDSAWEKEWDRQIPNQYQLEKWFKSIPHIVDCITGRLWHALLPSAPLALAVPMLEDGEQSSHIFGGNLAARWALASKLPQTHTKTWRRLFSSSADGRSFSRFCSLVMCRGPSILLIRDSDSNVFGCYAPCSWRRHNAYYGDASCFVFSLEPAIRLYEPSGSNTNFLWLSVGMQSCPNGVGVGGRLQFWGFFLSDGLEYGECRAPCSTFADMPQFTKNPKFDVADVEVWACLPDYEASDEELIAAGLKAPGNNSILDDNPDTVIFEMVGRGGYSKDIRQENPKEKEKEKEAGKE